MATLTISNLDARVVGQLRRRADEHGCSVEEEARRVLCFALLSPGSAVGTGTRLHERIKAISGGAEFEVPPRSLPRELDF